MKVKFVSTDMWSPALEFTLDSFPIVIGRNGSADVSVNDRWMSKRHCVVDRLDGELMIRDLDSKHGIFINGQPVSRANLKPGDVVTIGIRSFRVAYRQYRKKRKGAKTTA